MSIYRVRDWNKHFENNKSRERAECSFVCVPNKQHGLGFARIMSEPDGAAIYGIWICILGACSQQQKPREGWLTDTGLAPDGHQTGTAWAPSDLALKFRRPVSEIERALDVLTSSSVGWIECMEDAVGQDIAESARVVPAECPRGALEEKRIEENRKEENYMLGKPSQSEIQKSVKRDFNSEAEVIYEAYPRKIAKGSALKAIKRSLKRHPFDFLLAAAKRYAIARAGEDPNFTPYPATWFNREQFMDDPANWGRLQTSSKPQPVATNFENF